jgi:hypothetical protein
MALMDSSHHYQSTDLNEITKKFTLRFMAGAHLSAMALWERASRRVENAQRLLPETVDVRIPAGFLGLAGVYNIGEHFKYELQRGVAAVSCMRPVMGWEQGFDSMSPSLLFESLLTLPGVSFLPAGETDPAAQTQVRGLDLMPRCLFIVSHNDITVPPDSSFAFNSMLLALGCESRVVINDSLGHGDFVLSLCTPNLFVRKFFTSVGRHRRLPALLHGN